MLRAMFTVIKDGTFPYLARSLLLHLSPSHSRFFFLFRQNFPHELLHFRRPSLSLPSVVCPHIWKRCSACGIILGFRQLSRHSHTTSETVRMRFSGRPQLSSKDKLGYCPPDQFCFCVVFLSEAFLSLCFQEIF